MELTRIMIGFHMRMQHGLIRKLASSFNDARWPAGHRVPKVVIENLMSDETSHKLKVPGATPAWLQLVKARMRAGCKHKGITTSQPHSALGDDASGDCEFESDDDSDDDDDEASGAAGTTGGDADSEPPAKRMRTKVSTQSQTWAVCVVRRSISWLTMSGHLMYTPLISPPAPMRCKGAEYLWTVGVWGFLSHVIFSNPKRRRRVKSGMFPN